VRTGFFSFSTRSPATNSQDMCVSITSGDTPPCAAGDARKRTSSAVETMRVDSESVVMREAALLAGTRLTAVKGRPTVPPMLRLYICLP
jgi:hypothetical protein